MNGLDPVTFEVVGHKLLQISEEMGISYVRCSGSPVIVDANDMNAGVMLPDGQLSVIGPFLTLHAIVLSNVVRNALPRFEGKIHEGDMFICNDPHLGPVHQADVATVSPVFHEGEIVAWTGITGHQVDIGGKDPGGFSMGVVDIQQEGLRIPIVKHVEKGELREDLLAWILNQVRDPVVGLDLKAQIAANHIARKRMTELIAKYGLPTINAVMRQGIDHSEAKLRARLRQLPDGQWRDVQYIDHDGHAPNVYKIVVTLTKRDDHLSFDLAGTSRQALSCINCTYTGLVGGVLTPVLIQLAYDIPWNEGIVRCVSIEAETGTVANCNYPAPVSMATLGASWMITDAVQATLSKMELASEDYVREAMATWVGSCQLPAMAGISQHGYRFSMAEMSHHAGGGGARTYKDGLDMGGVFMNATPSIPNIEVNERAFPMLYLFRRQLPDSGGPGKYRGGVSGEICYILHDAPEKQVNHVVVSSGAEMPNAYGLSGGHPGAAVRWVRIRNTGIPERLRLGQPLPTQLADIPGDHDVFPPMHSRLPFVEGEAWYSNWQGGGGYGDPLDREPKAVLADVSAEVVSERLASEVYGVVFVAGSAPLAVDPDATERQRTRLRSERRQLASTPLAGPAEPARRHRVEGLSPQDLRPVSEYIGFLRSAGAYVCKRCGLELGPAGANLKHRLLRENAKLTKSGPSRGEWYDRDRFELRLFYCPDCLTLVDTEVNLKSEPPVDDLALLV